ncbi:MAG TPA: hypothetical protein DET40_15685 [Lentisphaeria bacterium]|nr:MAG: hypothetical protein A2X45_14210 [Lentisphaerae bacterium GWF2_50_93]HCE44981.1 hypothetical protein [Lentisphaeria bacterium]
MKSNCKSFLGVFAFVLFLISIQVLADGCFVWNGYDRLREPQQKAIIVHDEGVEDLILQVKYEGKAEDFGWIVPVPSMPEIKPMTYSPFPVLEKSPGIKIFKNYLDAYKKYHLIRYSTLEGGDTSRTTVVREDSVGIYKTSILKADNGSSLKGWLEENKFKVPEGGERALDYYIRKNWLFVAFRINASFINKDSAGRLARGELDPIHLIFKSDKPVYPLYISSMNADKTKLLIFLLSKRIYANEFFAPDESSYLQADDYVSGLKEMEHNEGVNIVQSIEDPISFHYKPNMNTVLFQEVNRSSEYDWYLVRMVREVENAKIQDDLVFTDEAELIKSIHARILKIQEQKGYEKLYQMACPMLQSKEYYNFRPVSAEIKIPPELSQRLTRVEFKKLLVGYLKNPSSSFNFAVDNSSKYDKNEVRLDMQEWIINEKISLNFLRFLKINGLISTFLQCATSGELVEFKKLCSESRDSDDLLSYDETDYDGYAKLRPSFAEILKDPSEGISSAVKCNIRFQRLLKLPEDYKVPSNIYENIRIEPDFFFGNDLKGEAQQQSSAYYAIYEWSDPVSFNIFRNWLAHRNPEIRRAALAQMLVSSFNNGYGFILESAMDKRKENADILRPLLDDPEQNCRECAAFILIRMNDSASKDFFLKTLNEGLSKPIVNDKPISDGNTPGRENTFNIFMMSLLEASLNRSPEYAKEIKELLKQKEKFPGSGPLYQELVIAGTAYFDDPEIRNRLLNEKDLPYLIPARSIVSRHAIPWIDSELAKKDNANLRLLRLAFENTSGNTSEKEIEKAINGFRAILKNPDLRLDSMNAFLHRNIVMAFMKFGEPYHMAVADLILSRQNELISLIRNNGSDTYGILLDELKAASERNPQTYLPALKEVLLALEEKAAKGNCNVAEMSPLDYKSALELIVANELFRREEIEDHIMKFPEGDINRRICNEILEGKRPEVSKDELNNNMMDFKTILYCFLSDARTRCGLYGGVTVPEIISQSLTPSSDPVLLSAAISSFERNRKMLAGILERLDSKKNLSWPEKLLKIKVSEELPRTEAELKKYSEGENFNNFKKYLGNFMDDKKMLIKIYTNLKESRWKSDEDELVLLKVRNRIEELNMEEIEAGYQKK